ncbi:uncharacterized protein LOC125902503 isoform X18 [Scomber scombrus]|uniref:Uncharacterized protein LOC125902503 isoform X18 n=1 Tax=Scomber scombrus TaxID=13677 RepID=A0AAV1NEN4_SCOSC
MDKSVLLVLLCLQAFLLTTAFTSADTDAVALVRNDHQPSPDQADEISVQYREQKRQRKRRYLQWRKVRTGTHFETTTN